MALRPEGWPLGREWRGMSPRKAEAELGIPWQTIANWWHGSKPFAVATRAGIPTGAHSHCRNGHPMSGDNVYINPGIDGKRQCRTCRRLTWRRDNWKRRRKFHPTLNPDLALAPLHMLWVPAAEVLALVDNEVGREDANQMLDHGSRAWRELRRGRKVWLRFDTADRILSELGLHVSRLTSDPIYSTTRPQGDPQ